MRKGNFIILGIILTTAVLVGGLFWYNKYQNKETIVDLGDGWESYHHNKIGLTVKVPEDAIIKRGYNDEHIIFRVSFSKGLVRVIGVDKSYYGKWKKQKDIYQKRIKAYRNKAKNGITKKYTEYITFKGKKVKIGKLTREGYYKDTLMNKELFIRYTDEKYENDQGYYKPHNTLSFTIISYGKNYFIDVDIEEIYKQNQYLKDTPFEKLGQEYAKIIEPYILEIDSP